jgi:hypothetical protein
MPPVFDTYASVRRLVEAGVPESQAAAIVREQAQMLADTVATRDDVLAIQARVTEVELGLKALELRVKALEVALEQNVKYLDQRIGSQIAASEARIIKYMVALAGTVVALVKWL